MKNKIKILHFLPTLNFGGAETNLLSLLDHFNHEKFEHHLAYTSGGDLEDRFKEKNIYLIKIANNQLNFRSPLNLIIMKRLMKYIKKNGINIVHSHLDLGNLLTIPVARSCHIPIILHFHGQGISYQGDRASGKGYRFWKLVGKLLYPCATHFIVIINRQRSYLSKIGINENRISYIPNGIAIGSMKAAQIELVEKEVEKFKGFRFVTIGKLYEAKNHKILLKSFQKVNSLFPSSYLFVVGDGPLRKELERLSGELKLQHNVYFMGKRAEVMEILSICNCFVLASLWELHPITILEAMAAGLPVIATNVGGVSGTVIDGETGFIVPPGDEEQLADAMLKILKDDEKAKLMGEKGEQIVLENFTQDRSARRIEEVYHKVYQESRKRV